MERVELISSKVLLLAISAFVMSACGVKTAIRNPHADKLAPNDPAALSWVESTPFNQNAVTATWTPSTSSDFDHQKIQFYSDANCTVKKGALIALPSKVTNSETLLTNIDGAYSYRIYSYDKKGNEGISSCSNPMLVDTTPPTIAISVPTNSSFINIASDSTNYKISGTCSEEGRTVTIQSDGTTVGTATCQSGAFDSSIPDLANTPVNSTLMTEVAHSITAMISDLATNATTSSAVSVTRDVTAPNNASSLAWTQSSPTNSTAITASWTVSTSTDLASQSLQFYADGSCSVPVGAPVSLGTSTNTNPFTGTDGQTYSYKITTTDLAGNPSTSTCSSPIVIDTTPPTVTITTAAPWINNSNKTAYTVSGACGDVGTGLSGGGLVTVKLNDGTTIKTSTVTCNSGAYSTTFNTTAATALTEGTNHITATASVTDLAGNTTTATQGTRSKDTVNPTLTLTSASIATWINNANNAAYAIAGTCGDATSGINGNITIGISDGSTTVTKTTSCTAGGTFSTSIDASSLLDGTNNITITASVSDVAGNSTTTAALLRSKDTVAPVLALVSPLSNTAIKGNAAVNITFNVTELNVQASPTATITCTGCTTTSYTKALSAGPLTTATTFTQTINTPNSNGTAIGVSIDYTDAAGNPATTLTANYTTDLNAPQVTMLTLNADSANSTTTNSNYLKVALQANDASSSVTDFCLKYNSSTAPTSSDSCWMAMSAAGLTPSASISFSTYYFRVGFTKMNYTVYGWVRDQAGNISSLSNSGAGTSEVDRDLIYFDPGTPPQVTALQVANTNSPSSPVAASELMVGSGNSIYIKWNASDLEGLAANPISIYYTTDDTNYALFTGGSNLQNALNGTGCTVTTGFTGCVVLTSPSSTYYRVRVVATDTLGTTVFYNSVPVNDTKVRFLAGNLETGLNGSAATAVFGTWGSGKASASLYKHRLVVSDDGKIFYYDPINGLVWVDPANGVLKQFIKIGASIVGNGSVIDANTRIKTFRGIALDHSNNLLIYDYDQIRKVNLSTMVITQFIGGGTVETPTVPVAPTTFKINPSNLGGYFYSNVSLNALPNGDLIFNSNQLSAVDYRYEASSNTIIPINYTGGVGLSNQSTWSWDHTELINGTNYRSYYADIAFNFDPATFIITNFLKAVQYRFPLDQYQLYTRMDYPNGGTASGYPGIGSYNLNGLDNRAMFTGLDGKIYTVPRGRYFLERVTISNSTSIPSKQVLVGISGSYPNAPCADGTLATACSVDIDTFFVNKAGNLYFSDQGTIRTLDDSGKVVTIFGQQPSYGTDNDATLAMNARFGNIFDIKPDPSATGDGRIVIMDAFANLYRELNINANVPKFPGSRSVCYNWTGPWRFGIDPNNGDLYSTCSVANLYKYTRSGTSTMVAGNGVATSYYYYDPLADGKPGANISFSSAPANAPTTYARSVLGILNNKIFLSRQVRINGVETNCMIKAYDISNNLYTQSHFMGDSTCSNTSPVAGNALATTAIYQDGGTYGPTNIDYSAQLGAYLFSSTATNKVFYSTFGGNIAALTGALPHSFYNFTHKDRLSNMIDLYYCGSTTGKLYKYSVNSSTQVGSETTLTWSMPGLTCKPNTTLHYKEPTATTPNGSLIFVTRQNGLDGIGEYVF